MEKNIIQALDLAESHSDEGEFEIAIDILREALRNHPNNLKVRTMLGVVLAKAYKDRDSEKMLRSVLRQDPYHEEAVSALGRLLDNSLRTQEAEQLLRNLLRNKKNSHLIMNDLTRMLLEEGRIEEAYSLAKDFIQRNPNELKSYTLLRELYLLDEIRLEDNLLDSDYKSSEWESLVTNLLEQYDLTKKIVQLSDTNNLEPDFLSDEMSRLLGRFEELKVSLDRVDGKVSKPILDSMNQALAEISKYKPNN